MLSTSFAAHISFKIDKSSLSVTFNQALCTGCNSCVRACKSVAGQNVLALQTIDSKQYIATRSKKDLSLTNCVGCGQCTLACGTGAFSEVDSTQVLAEKLKEKPKKTFIVQVAPAVRVNLSEMLGYKPGSVTTGQLVSSLKKIGFDFVYDTTFSADLTIVEEANELVDRIKSNKTLPMFTSCCPGWVNYVEKSAPKLIPSLSSCKSPMGMLSALIKSDFLSQKKLDKKDIYSVAIMPCTAKKDEAKNGETDLVLTTRELGKLIKKLKIDYKKLPETNFDSLYGKSTGAGIIFGASGGVLDAAVRTAYKYVTGKELQRIEFDEIRAGKDGIKFGQVDFDGLNVKVAVVQGLANAMKLITQIEKKDPAVEGLKFVEVMACPGGCVNGGGSPKAKTKKIVELRESTLFDLDKGAELRFSHSNPEVHDLYERLLKSPGSGEAHHLLHTKFTNRKQ